MWDIHMTKLCNIDDKEVAPNKFLSSILLIHIIFLAQLFSKKSPRYCYSPGVVVGSMVVVRKL